MRRFLSAAIGAAALGLAALTATNAAAQVEWRLNINYLENRADSAAIKRFVERVNERAAGKLKITPYWANALGFKQEDSLRLLRNAAVEMTTVNGIYFPRDEPAYAASWFSGLVSDPAAYTQALPTLLEIVNENIDRWEGVPVAYVTMPAVNWHIMCKDPIKSLEELKGKKLRAASKTVADAFNQVGVATQTVPQLELYLALQTGVVDCALLPASIAPAFSLQEVAPNALTVWPYLDTPTVLAVPKTIWAQLPADLQAIVKEEGAKVWEETLALALDPEAIKTEESKLPGIEKITILGALPEEDLKAVVAAIRGEWTKQLEKVGERGLSVRDRLKDKLDVK
jgi:TRAP-type C4-dicarboxylate transport system substrate-binding protein